MFREILLPSFNNINDYAVHIYGNMRTYSETTELEDLNEKKLHNQLRN